MLAMTLSSLMADGAGVLGQRIGNGYAWLRRAAGALIGIAVAACQSPVALFTPPPETVLEPGTQPVVQQQWQLQPGSVVAERTVVAGLGDISIALEGGSVYAPFSGSLQATGRCAVFTSPDLPAYLTRLCGLRRVRSGPVQRGDRLGSGQMLHFATLRKQPDGTWAIVEPSQDLVSRFLAP